MKLNRTNETVRQAVAALADGRRELIKNSPSAPIGGRVAYYVSADGDDLADGRSPETAWRTLGKVGVAELGENSAVLFRRGDTFRGYFEARPGVLYSAYGEGGKPILSGSPEDGADPEKWSAVPDASGIWKFYRPMPDCGALIYNGGEAVSVKMIPDYLDGCFMKRNGENAAFSLASDMTQNHCHVCFADSCTEHGKPDMWEYGTVGELYMRCDEGNPGEVFSSIEFSPRVNGIQFTGDGITVDSLALRYYGAHGIAAGYRNSRITFCEFDFIGGGIQDYEFKESKGRHQVIRFGNGIEVWEYCDGYYVENCRFDQIYDAAITHQGTATALERNIVYRGNLVERSIYSFEYFLCGEKEGDGMINVLYEDNICRDAGYGWGYQRPDRDGDAHVKTWQAPENVAVNFVIRNNIFDSANGSLCDILAKKDEWLPKLEGNVYIGKRGSRVGRYNTPYTVLGDDSLSLLGDAEGELYIL